MNTLYFVLFISISLCTLSLKCEKIRNVAVIGGGGNIGSELTLYLKSKGLNVTAYDDNPQLSRSILHVIKMNSRSIKIVHLQSYDVIIFLGGCTSRVTCSELSVEERYKRNVLDLLDIVDRMKPTQHFITASTGAIAEGRRNSKETDGIFEYLLDEYTESMYTREIELKNKTTQSLSPRVTVFRFGTVIGVSVGQRTDLSIPTFFQSAYYQRMIEIRGPSTLRSYLWLNDLNRAFYSVMNASFNWKNVSIFNVWNLASFDTTILRVAERIAALTNTTNTTIKSSSDSLKTWFTVDCSSFKKQFNFVFQGNLTSVLHEFHSHIPDSITAKGIHRKTIPCPVCGSFDQKIVLELGDHPFANSFHANITIALTLPRQPIKLVWCRRCNHFHLSHVVDREDLFLNYLYQSGTSKTLNNYFEWMAHKVIKESGKEKNGVVLEIGCSDGSQLDHFKQMKWKTFGVDPAANLATLAITKGHTVKIGFWGEEHFTFPELPLGNKLHAILAENVLAHTSDPVNFLKVCASVMGKNTLLYIQTSQCNMHELGQFDTAYHEHISFFTAHSFMTAATLAGLYISSFETTPIHGTSCLLTMKIKNNMKSKNLSNSLKNRLEYERHIGITTDSFYENFSIRSHQLKFWILDTIKDLQSKMYVIGGYGAAAKGMTLLHFISHNKNMSELLEFVLDDAPLKQYTYCPGTSIPVYPVKFIGEIDSQKPLALIIFAWNFWEEIAETLNDILYGKRDEVVVIIPFPSPRLISLQIKKL